MNPTSSGHPITCPFCKHKNVVVYDQKSTKAGTCTNCAAKIRNPSLHQFWMLATVAVSLAAINTTENLRICLVLVLLVLFILRWKYVKPWQITNKPHIPKEPGPAFHGRLDRLDFEKRDSLKNNDNENQ